MLKKKFLSFLPLILLLSAFTHPALADESITITTYYPSPYGSYKELRAQRMAIGDNYITSSYCWPPTVCANQIDANADLVVEGNVGIGTTGPDPAAKLEVAGQVKITGGTLGAGKVLTDVTGSGLASWQTASGGVTTQNDVTGSRALNAAYQNTSGRAMFVNVELADNRGVGSVCAQDIRAYVDSSSNPTTTVYGVTVFCGNGSQGTATFIVLPGYWYKVISTAVIPVVVRWIEWN